MDDVLELDQTSPADGQASDDAEATPAEPDYGPNFEKLPEERISELRDICSKMNKRDQWARMVEIIRVTLRRYFWNGIQHGFWNADEDTMQIGPNGGAIQGENLNDEELFQGDFNIYTQNGKMFVATFSQSAASSRMDPSKPNDPASIRAAREAEKFVRIYEKYNPPKVAQQTVGRYLWNDGRIVAVTDFGEDDENLGYEEDEDGNPVPRQAEITEYFGVLESKVPIIEKFAKWPYCKISRELDKVTAQYDNPTFAKEIETSAKGITPNDEIARMSRIAVAENIAQISSDTLATLVTEDRWWLRPQAFMELPEPSRAFWIGGQEEGEDGKPGKKIQGICEQGCRVKFFGKVYCGLKPMAMSRQLRVMHALPGEGNSRPSLGDAMVPVQMEFNDAVGMYSELLHKCIPRTWVNMTVEEIQTIIEQVSRWGEYSPMVNPNPTQPLEQQFFQEVMPDIPASFPAWVENLQGTLSQFLTGNVPALMGTNTETDDKTYKGFIARRDQALGMMSLVWVPFMFFIAGIRGQAARMAAERDVDKISETFPTGQNRNEVVEVSPDLLRGGFLSVANTDQNFPTSWTDRSNTWKSLAAAAPANPLLAKQMMQPDNLVAMRDAIGLDDEFVIDGADSRDLQLDEWAQMQKGEGPIEDQQATVQRDQARNSAAQQAVDQLAPGEEAPPLPELPAVQRSSVPIDEETDDHVVHALEMFRILNSPEGQQIKRDKPEVWQDGKLHMLAHEAAAAKKGIPMPPPLGGPMPAPVGPPAHAGAPGGGPPAPAALPAPIHGPGAPVAPPGGGGINAPTAPTA